jgi:Uma2 family endonuclease
MQVERTTGLTYEDWLALGEHNAKHELIGGELIVPPTPSVRHQRIVTEIGLRLLGYARAHGGEAFLLPLDSKLSDTDVVQPDAMYLRPESLERLTDRGLLGPPDLAVEVLSPWTRQVELTRKRRLYEQHGVLEYWVVDPEAERIDVYVLEDGRCGLPRVFGSADTLRPSMMPGLEIAIADALGSAEG